MGKKFIVIIVNHCNANDTIECLQTLFKQSYTHFSVIVVDNSPSNKDLDLIINWANGKMEFLDTQFPHLTGSINRINIPFNSYFDDVIESLDQNKKLSLLKTENRGFAAANNIAIKYIESNNFEFDNLWFLNNDTVVTPDALFKINQFLLQNSDNDIIGTSLMEYDKPDEIQSVASGFDTTFFRTKSFKDLKKVGSNYQLYPNGASFILSNSFLKAVKGLNESYFLYFEELDLVKKGKKEGFKINYLIDKIVYHKGGGSTGKNSAFADYHYLKSRLMAVREHYSSKLPLLVIFTFFVYPFNRVLRGQYNRVSIMFKVFKDFFTSNSKATDL